MTIIYAFFLFSQKNQHPQLISFTKRATSDNNSTHVWKNDYICTKENYLTREKNHGKIMSCFNELKQNSQQSFIFQATWQIHIRNCNVIKLPCGFRFLQSILGKQS